MSTFFRSIKDARSALLYIDDILLLADGKPEKFGLIKELQIIAKQENLELAPKKSIHMLLKLKVLEKKDVFFFQFLGSVNFYSKPVEKLHVNLKPLYNLLDDEVEFEWTPELAKIFQNVENAMTADTELTIPNTKHPFFYNSWCLISWFRRSRILKKRK